MNFKNLAIKICFIAMLSIYSSCSSKFNVYIIRNQTDKEYIRVLYGEDEEIKKILKNKYKVYFIESEEKDFTKIIKNNDIALFSPSLEKLACSQKNKSRFLLLEKSSKCEGLKFIDIDYEFALKELAKKISEMSFKKIVFLYDDDSFKDAFKKEFKLQKTEVNYLKNNPEVIDQINSLNNLDLIIAFLKTPGFELLQSLSYLNFNLILIDEGKIEIAKFKDKTPYKVSFSIKEIVDSVILKSKVKLSIRKEK